MIEIKHLRTLVMLKQNGSLARAAEALCTSQSALSHQINALEDKLAQRLYIRKSQPLMFTDSGLTLVKFADKVINELDIIVADITPNKQQLSYSLGFACHACFQWLLPVTSKLQQSNKIKFDYHGERFDNSLDLDILFTDDKPKYCQYKYQSLGEFSQVALVHHDHSLSKQAFVTPAMIAQHLLLTYPLPNEELDVFRRFLTPAGQTAKQVRKVANSQTMLQMVNANMGIAVLPQWLANDAIALGNISALPLGEQGLQKQLYVRIKPTLMHHHPINLLIDEAKEKFIDLVSLNLNNKCKKVVP